MEFDIIGDVHGHAEPLEALLALLDDRPDIVADCRDAWNKLIDRQWKIMNLGRRQWVRRS